MPHINRLSVIKASENAVFMTYQISLDRSKYLLLSHQSAKEHETCVILMVNKGTTVPYNESLKLLMIYKNCNIH